jgi:hypothetical protein
MQLLLSKQQQHVPSLSIAAGLVHLTVDTCGVEVLN